MISRTLLILLCGSTLAGSVVAGNLDPPAAPTDPASAMFTLTDLYNRLNAGTAGVKRSSVFLEPAAGPTAGTGHTLNEIMAEMPPAIDTTNGAGMADVLAGKTFWGLTSGAWGLQTGTATAGASFTGTNGSLSMTIPDGLYSGSKTATASDSNLTAANIKTGITIFNVPGSYTCTAPTGTALAGDVLTGKTFSNASATDISGTMANNAAFALTCGVANQSVTAGYYSGGTLTGDAALISANIKSGVTIFGVAGDPNVVDTGDPNVVDTSSGDAVAADLATGKKAWVAGNLVTGSYTAPPAFSAPFPVAKTGDATENGNDPKGVTWPNPRFTCNPSGDCTIPPNGVGNGTVTDNLTGLVWLQNANCATVSPKAWVNAQTAVAALASGDCGLSDGSVAGQWRLPNIKELSSLVNAGATGPALPSDHPFTGVQSNNYWSSTSYAGSSTNFAWYVNLYDGGVYAFGDTLSYPVWPVRGGL